MHPILREDLIILIFETNIHILINVKSLAIFIIFLFSSLFACTLQAQYIPVHPTNQVYDFLKELSNDQNPVIHDYSKPFSRVQIADYLSRVNRENLNQRQIKELDFYLRDFSKELPELSTKKRLDLLYYRDSLFNVTLNPILGGNYYFNENGTAWHWWNGAEGWATIGKWGFWGSLRDNHESEFLTQPAFLNQNYGGANFKIMDNGQVDYWEVRGGVSYDFGIGNIAVMKDHFSWGSNYNGANILSGRTPSFPHIHLELNPVKWFEFKYVHAWLSSDVIDSTRSFNTSNAYGDDYRIVYHGKFMAANLFSFTPFKKLQFSFGNSIIYDYDNPHLAYLIPVMFYKAIDHQLNSGINNMNSQIFFDLSARPFRHLHLYSTLFLDEFAAKRINDPDNHNFYSLKAGFHLSNLIPNFYGGLEYTHTNALTFQHFVPTTTFESNSFNLGHYLEDNAKELFMNIGYKAFRNLGIELAYCSAKKGPDHTLLGTLPRMTIEPFTPIVWESESISLKINWQIINDVYIRMNYSFRNITGEEEYLEIWTPEFYQGKTNTLNLGLNIGF